MGDQEEKKALELMAEADKKLNSTGFMGGLFSGGGNKADEAIELYQRAAILFKINKKWGNAGEAFVKAGELHLKAADRDSAARNFVNAAMCYKMTDAKQAVPCMERAIEQYLEMGTFSLAAKHHETIAEIWEAEGELDKAVTHYEQAADYFKGEELTASGNKCLLKVAQHAAKVENYEKAINVYEEVASSSLKSSLYTAKEYFFRAAICHLCVDVKYAKQALEGYVNLHPAFQNSTQHDFLKNLVELGEAQNANAFTEAVKDYDSIGGLAPDLKTLVERAEEKVKTAAKSAAAAPAPKNAPAEAADDKEEEDGLIVLD